MWRKIVKVLGRTSMGLRLIQDATQRSLTRRLRKTGHLPRKRKIQFSRKQLAAQRLFAKRARAGTLRRGRKRRSRSSR